MNRTFSNNKVLVAIAAVGSALVSIMPASAQQLDMGVKPPNFSVVIWNHTNAYRQANGLPKLERDFDLGQAAQKYAEFLASTNTLGHNADGLDPGVRIAAEGFQACYWSENVYEQWSSPTLVPWRTAAAGAMAFWRNSSGHAANMKNAKAKRMGVGVAAWKHGNQSYYKVVQVFGDDCRASTKSKNLGKKP